jgi:hypothetical protein
MRTLITGIYLFIALSPFAQGQRMSRDVELKLLSDNVFCLSEVMLHDVTSPPAAARFYAYAMLGAYEVALMSGRVTDIRPLLKTNPGIAVPHTEVVPDLSFCSNYVILEIGRQLMPSGERLVKKKQELLKFYKGKSGYSPAKLKAYIKVCDDIAARIVGYAAEDNYNKLSTYTRYSPNRNEGYWYPTPPEYMAAVEPRWGTIRPFFLDSARQFTPAAPAQFSKDPESRFYKMMMEVYDMVNNVTQEQLEIANFWDCNPFAVTYSGHLAIGLKKISPGGHWMGITGIACRQSRISLDSAIVAHTLVALTLHDAFISCWEEKYISDRIRPESAINNLIDPSWRPVLQTPPFPEYTSGHSVASAAVAEVLTWLFGDNFSYIDDSEVYFGLPERRFSSFRQAGQEAAVSRLYGGIHFRDACEEGVEQGEKLGRYIISRLAHKPH